MRPDLVSFVLGCSFSFEHALIDAGIELRHVVLAIAQQGSASVGLELPRRAQTLQRIGESRIDRKAIERANFRLGIRLANDVRQRHPIPLRKDGHPARLASSGNT